MAGISKPLQKSAPPALPANTPTHTMAGTALADDRMIFIGKKDLMSYVLAVVTQFQRNQREVILKARGKAIARAVDVAEIVRNRFVTDAKVKSITIGTEEVADDEGKDGKTKVSSIEITLSR
jgi:DNA-binding protein